MKRILCSSCFSRHFLLRELGSILENLFAASLYADY